MKQPHQKCSCSSCARDQHFQVTLEQLPEQHRHYFEGIYESLCNTECELDVYRAIVRGTWPDADDIIKRARETRTPPAAEPDEAPPNDRPAVCPSQSGER